MNTQKVLQVLRKERGLCKGQLQNGARCVVGALLFHAGYTKGELRRMSDSLNDDYSPLENRARGTLLYVYDIDDRTKKDLINLNDVVDKEDECSCSMCVPEGTAKSPQVTSRERLAIVYETIKAGAFE